MDFGGVTGVSEGLRSTTGGFEGASGRVLREFQGVSGAFQNVS